MRQMNIFFLKTEIYTTVFVFTFPMIPLSVQQGPQQDWLNCRHLEVQTPLVPYLPFRQSAMSCTKVTIRYRRATLSDYDGVMAIGSMYGGRDYLWSLYKQLIGDPDNYGIVALDGDRIVSIRSCFSHSSVLPLDLST